MYESCITTHMHIIQDYRNYTLYGCHVKIDQFSRPLVDIQTFQL
jgi:hypothetical protein